MLFQKTFLIFAGKTLSVSVLFLTAGLDTTQEPAVSPTVVDLSQDTRECGDRDNTTGPHTLTSSTSFSSSPPVQSHYLGGAGGGIEIGHRKFNGHTV